MTFTLGLCDSEMQAVHCTEPVPGDVTMDMIADGRVHFNLLNHSSKSQYSLEIQGFNIFM